jgi:hypothetical protein
MLFSDQKRYSISLPATDKDGKPSNVAYLIEYLCEEIMKDTRKELFVLDNHMYVSLTPWGGDVSDTLTPKVDVGEFIH